MRTSTRRCEGGDDFELEVPPADFGDLFRGPPGVGESAEQRAARLAAARDVLAELLEEGEHDPVSLQTAWYAVRLGGAELLRSTTRVATEAA
ncbi:hypothetical protein [Streptomyces sp. NPDC087270]|uniref:hypothetical protein n=1 Tax=Streptomyces sp. NPDC087270 TaxID=3365774 RepID=UPI003804BF49